MFGIVYYFVWTLDKLDDPLYENPKIDSRTEYQQKTDELFNIGMDTLGLYKAIQYGKNNGYQPQLVDSETQHIGISNDDQKTDNNGRLIHKMPNGEDKIWDGQNWVNPN